MGDKKNKFNMGAELEDPDQLKVSKLLERTKDSLAFNLEDIESFTGEPMRIDWNCARPIFKAPGQAWLGGIGLRTSVL